jgi:putative membrane protein
MIEQKNEEIIEMKSVDSTEVKHINPITDWFIRLLKGALVGIGFILPGLSGGCISGYLWYI